MSSDGSLFTCYLTISVLTLGVAHEYHASFTQPSDDIVLAQCLSHVVNEGFCLTGDSVTSSYSVYASVTISFLCILSLSTKTMARMRVATLHFLPARRFHLGFSNDIDIHDTEGPILTINGTPKGGQLSLDTGTKRAGE